MSAKEPAKTNPDELARIVAHIQVRVEALQACVMQAESLLCAIRHWRNAFSDSVLLDALEKPGFSRTE